MKDYYKTLGVEKNASKDDIKKAFRKLAHEHHPDKTKGDAASSQKFKEASEAYSVLSDDSKRSQYDRFGSAGPSMGGAGQYGAGGFGGQGGFGGFNAQDFGGFDFSGFTQGGANGQGGVEFDLGDIFGDFFGGGRGRSGASGGSPQRGRQKRGHDVSVDIQMTFEESIFGVEREIHVTKTSSCVTCSGTGAKPGTGMKTCDTCAGKGQVNETRRSFLGTFNTTRICDICHGKGQVPKEKCPTCHGEGVLDRQQEIIAKIPAGIEDGEMVRLSGMGEAVAGGIAGDMYVKVHVKTHQFIQRDGYNLATELRIKLTTAITGGEQTVKTLDGDLVLKIPEGSNNGDTLRIRGKGVPNDRGHRGDFLVKLSVEMPRKLSRTAREAIEKLKGEGM